MSETRIELRQKLWLAQWLREVLLILSIAGLAGFGTLASVFAARQFPDERWLQDAPLWLSAGGAGAFLAFAIKWTWQLKRGERLGEELDADAYAKDLERDQAP